MISGTVGKGLTWETQATVRDRAWEKKGPSHWEAPQLETYLSAVMTFWTIKLAGLNLRGSAGKMSESKNEALPLNSQLYDSNFKAV